MSNLTALAFPFIEPSNNENGSVSTGFTKHELAAIIISANLAGHLLSDIGSTNIDAEDTTRLANIAYNLAAELLNKF